MFHIAARDGDELRAWMVAIRNAQNSSKNQPLSCSMPVVVKHKVWKEVVKEFTPQVLCFASHVNALI